MATRPTASPTPPGFPIVKLSNNKAQMDMALNLRAKDNAIRGVQEKLFVAVTDYASTPHVYLTHAIDGPVFRVIAHTIVSGRFSAAVGSAAFGKEPVCRVQAAQQVPGAQVHQWTEFKGGAGADGVRSRILSLSYLDAPGQEYPWSLVLSEGPGRIVGAGAVVPTGAPTQRIQMRLSGMQTLQWMTLGLEALQAHTLSALLQSPLIPAGR